MFKNRIYIMILSIFCLISIVEAQTSNEVTYEIKGIVCDSQGEPLVGANVVIKDAPGFGTITDIDGRFTIKVQRYQRLIISFVGFESQEVLIKKRDDIHVNLKESENNVLNEIVITGTGEHRKATITGAVTAVNVNDLSVAPSGNITNALAGNVSGVLAMQTSGQPGKNTSEFWIRGISTFGAKQSALVLVDGFERDMNDINIEDIESFQVLKDAAETAIYGSRGANGVVLITTKHGAPGKISISAKAETSYNQFIFLPEFVDGYTYASMLNEAQTTRNLPVAYQPDELYMLQHGLDKDLLPNVDWRDIVLRNGAMTYKANMNFQGGSSNVRYFASVSYINEQGMYKTDEELKKDYNTNTNVHRWNYRMNADINLTKSTLVKIGVSGMLKKFNDTGRGSDVVWRSLNGTTPVAIPQMYSNGYIPAASYDDAEDNKKDNPWVAATQTGYRQSWNNQMQTNITLDQKLDFIVKGLKFIGRFGFDTYNESWITKIKSPERWKAERFRDSDGNLVFKRLTVETPMKQESGGSGNRREFFEAELHFNRIFDNHHLNSILKYNQDSKLRTNAIGTDLKNSAPVRHLGLSGRVAYDWSYRYFVNFQFGYTGSENFAAENRFGFFPAFSLAWNIAEEDWIKRHAKWLSMLKLRYSWGQVGSDAMDERFPYMYTIGSNGSYDWADFAVNNKYDGYTYTKNASNGVSWEIATKNDIGIDISILNDSFSLTADYFDERRDGIFMLRSSLPLTVGLFDGSAPKANVGSVRSRGCDGNFALKHSWGDFNMTLRGNMTYSYNEILERDEGGKQYPYQYTEGYQVGQSKGLVALGLFKDWDDIRNSPVQTQWGRVEPGDIKYKDVNGDGQITDNDKVAIGLTDRPSFIYGFGASLQWKGIDASVHFQGAGQSTFKVSGSLVQAFCNGDWGNISKDVAENRWISKEISGTEATENPNAKYPRLEYGNENGNNRQESSFWLRDGSYLRLKTLELGYSFPKRIINKAMINNLRVFFTGTNLLTFSKFKLWDPETRSSDGTVYPIPRTLTLGLNVNF